MGSCIRSFTGIVLLVLFVAPWGSGAPAAYGGDAVVAKTLLDSGKKALNAKKYDEAIPLFRKAFAEDPTLIEAVYWRAQAHEKMKDDAAALADYREFLVDFTKKAGPSADDQRLKGLAEKRVDALAVGDKEFGKLEDKYVADLLAMAKAKVAGDPGAALDAVNRVLEVQPKNAEALALRDKLGEKKAAGPFDGVASWRDIVKDKGLHSDVVKYPGDLMTIEIKSGGKIRPEPPITMSTDYAGEMEFRVAEVFDQAWSVGFSLGETKDGFYEIAVTKAEVRVQFGKVKQRPDDVASFATPPVDPAAWHRLGFAVHGAKFLVYLDGEQVIDETQTIRNDFAGDLGILVRTCRAEFRTARTGAFQ